MLFFFSLACVLLGIIGLYYVLLDLSVRFWPVVSVKLTYCDITTLKSQIASKQAVYSLSAKFDYEYKGTQYSSGKLCLSGAIKADTLAWLSVKKAEIEDTQLSGYVCPIAPALAVLSQEPLRNIIQYYFIMLFGFGVPVLMESIENLLFQH